MGFFTDTSICIGCKACEVACKEWNLIPEDGSSGPARATTTRRQLGANTWRHVAFVEQRKPLRIDGDGVDARTRRAAALADVESDVCKHCTHAGVPRRLPDGLALPHRVRHRRRAGGHLQRLRLLRARVPVRRARQAAPAARAGDAPLALPLLGRRRTAASGSARSATTGSKGGHEPACAKACPTDSIQFGELDELRERAGRAAATSCRREGWNGARLYGRDPDDGVGGFGAFFLLLDEPEVYGLPPDPVVTTRDLPALWRTTALAAAATVVGTALAFLGGRVE